ncbi:MAG: hypothetical protein BWK79_13260 [Beggiatoa sp. IS2]|nr:MAG: hypothetical protein BWK79_13260 [Beggiatoa sp. IS2]
MAAKSIDVFTQSPGLLHFKLIFMVNSVIYILISVIGLAVLKTASPDGMITGNNSLFRTTTTLSLRL